jgi:hypothetical protein
MSKQIVTFALIANVFGTFATEQTDLTKEESIAACHALTAQSHGGECYAQWSFRTAPTTNHSAHYALTVRG